VLDESLDELDRLDELPPLLRVERDPLLARLRRARALLGVVLPDVDQRLDEKRGRMRVNVRLMIPRRRGGNGQAGRETYVALELADGHSLVFAELWR
jgi:hypothetical protein